MPHTVKWLSNLPIERKLFLASVVPMLAVIVLSLVTYRSVQTFSEDEEQLNNIYLAQRQAAEYMQLALDLQVGFRGYVLTQQERFLDPFRQAEIHVLLIGDSLAMMVSGREAQHHAILQVQQLLKRHIAEKNQLIEAIKSGNLPKALRYVEEGRGRMDMIREHMARFDRLEAQALNDALAKLSRDRSLMVSVILGGGILALVLMMVTLHLIAQSITAPLVSLAKTMGAATGGDVPDVPILERRDEIGALTDVMSAMGAQVRDHIARVERSEAELRTVNRDLADSEAKYRSIVDHAPFGIFRTEGMAMVYSNRYNRLLAGLNPDEEGDPEAIRQSFHPEDRERVLSEYAQAVKDDRPYETVFRFLHKDGTVKKVLSRRIPIKDDAGRTIMYQGFNIDITALDQMQARLSRAERLATLGQMAAGIAHEIRNPLVGIGSTASLLLEEADPSDPRRPEFETILKETRRLDRIVNQIIDYARPRPLAPLLFSMEELIHETLTLLEAPLSKKQVDVEQRLPPHLPPIQADRDQLKQVLLNVIQNAIEALNEGGRLHISAFGATRAHEPGLTLTFSDNGAGITQADLLHVFEPFFTIGKHHGTGLGLAICRNIVDAHQGEIRLESEPGRGTTATLWLPLRQPSIMLGG
ncbi:MAG: CHASE3 domain-containing protein [Nitrospirota bacterium]|nr:CHASE3 domain-containing protein [Nitrospirota bacterium]